MFQFRINFWNLSRNTRLIASNCCFPSSGIYWGVTRNVHTHACRTCMNTHPHTCMCTWDMCAHANTCTAHTCAHTHKNKCNSIAFCPFSDFRCIFLPIQLVHSLLLLKNWHHFKGCAPQSPMWNLVLNNTQNIASHFTCVLLNLWHTYTNTHTHVLVWNSTSIHSLTYFQTVTDHQLEARFTTGPCGYEKIYNTVPALKNPVNIENNGKTWVRFVV